MHPARTDFGVRAGAVLALLLLLPSGLISGSPVAHSLGGPTNAAQVSTPRWADANLTGLSPSQEVNVNAGYSQEPAPMGIADYGVAPSGPYTYATNSSVGVAEIDSLDVRNASGSSEMSMQLNVNLQFDVQGRLRVYWIQNVADILSSSDSIVFIDNVWNFSASGKSALDPLAISGQGQTASSGKDVFYYDVASQSLPGNDVELTLPAVVQFEVDAGLDSNGQPVVQFEYNDGQGWQVYDAVTFLTSGKVAMPGFVVDGSGYNPEGLFYDSEFIIGGPGNGLSTSDVSSGVRMQLYYYNGNNYQMVTNAYNFGGDTAEAIGNVTDGWYYYPDDGENIAYLSAGAGTLGRLYSSSDIGIIDYTSQYSAGTLEIRNATNSSAVPDQIPFTGGQASVTVYPGEYALLLSENGVTTSLGDYIVEAGQTTAVPGSTGTGSVEMVLSYSVEGGGSGYSAPTLTYVTNGVTKNATLSTSPQAFEVDSGSVWTVNSVLTGSTSSERWETAQATSGAASSETVNFVYYNQYLQTLSFSVSDSSKPTPSFTADQFGTPVSQVLSATAKGYWFDSGSPWSVSDPIFGGTGERWVVNSTVQPVSGTISGTQSIDFAYDHQFQVTFAVSPSGEGSTTPAGSGVWEDAGTLTISAAGDAGYVFSAWSSSTLSINFANPQSELTTATVLGTGRITATFVFEPLEQVQVSVSMSPKGSTPVTVSVSGCDSSVASIPADGATHTFVAEAQCSLTFTAPTETSGLVWEFSGSGNGSATWIWTTGSSGSGANTNTLYVLDREMVAYSVDGSGAGYAPPTLAFQALGSPRTYTMTASSSEVDIDYGSPWTATNTLGGSGASERWVGASSALAGNSVPGGSIDPTYQQQFLLTVSGGESPSSQWYNDSSTAQLSMSGVYGRSSGLGERVTSYAIDGGSPVDVAPTTGTVSISIPMNSAHTLTIDSVEQYEVTISASASSALGSITQPTIAGDSYWYDSGTSVSLVLYGTWNRTEGTGERLASYSLNGVSNGVSTTGRVVVLSGPLASPEAVSAVIVKQYQLTTATGSVASVTPPSVAGDGGWYDGGTRVALTYDYSWNGTSDSRYNAESYGVGGDETPLNRSGDGTFSVQVTMTAPETVTISFVVQYSLTVMGGSDVSLSSNSPTQDGFYDAGTALTATTDYAWGLVNDDARQNLVSFTIDSSTTNVTRESSGSFTTPSIVFSGARTITFNSVTQYLATFQFEDDAGTHTIAPTSVQIQLGDPTVVSVPPGGIWLDEGTTFQIYDIQWQGVDVKPADQTTYTVDSPLNQVVLDRVYSGDVVATDYLGLPVAGAKVTVTLANGTTVALTTGSNGSVALREIPIGTFNATIAYLGTSTTVHGDAATLTTADAKIPVSYPLLGVVAVLAVVAAVIVIAVRRARPGRQVAPAASTETHTQACKRCNAPLEAGSTYCPNCGEKAQ